MSRMLYTQIKQTAGLDSLTCCVCDNPHYLTARCAYCREMVCRDHQQKVQMNKKGIVTMCHTCVHLYEVLVCTTYAGC
jgi:hypothetical protein